MSNLIVIDKDILQKRIEKLRVIINKLVGYADHDVYDHLADLTHGSTPLHSANNVEIFMDSPYKNKAILGHNHF